MLENMGWSRGKGLGANEDGITDHINVKVKSNKHGVGCDVKHANNWISHQDDFNSLLSQLQENHDEESPQQTSSTDPVKVENVSSLENKSKTSGARLHYHKFTRGKDLSKYGNEALDCILGKKKNTCAIPKIKSQAPVVNANSETDTSTSEDENMERQGEKKSDVSGLNTITSSTNIADYFAQKMSELNKKRMTTVQIGEASTDMDLNDERPCFQIGTTEISEEKQVKTEESLLTVSRIDEVNICTNITTEKRKKKKKKKATKVEVVQEELGEKKKHVSELEEREDQHAESDTQKNAATEECDVDSCVSNHQVKKTKKKKKRKKSEITTAKEKGDNVVQSIDEGINETKSPKYKKCVTKSLAKKRKKEIDIDGTSKPSSSDDRDAKSSAKKRKKMASDNTEKIVDNDATTACAKDSVSESSKREEEKKNKRKIKKKKRRMNARILRKTLGKLTRSQKCSIAAKQVKIQAVSKYSNKPFTGSNIAEIKGYASNLK